MALPLTCSAGQWSLSPPKKHLCLRCGHLLSPPPNVRYYLPTVHDIQFQPLFSLTISPIERWKTHRKVADPLDFSLFAVFRAMESLVDPEDSLILWKTPGATLPVSDVPPVSPLLSYTLIFSQVVKLLDIWDLHALIGAGSPALTHYLRQHNTTINAFKSNGLCSRRNQPTLNREPFEFICSFPNLTSISIINPTWIAPFYPKSPLHSFPRGLRHLTIWTKPCRSIDNIRFALVPYAELFPQLETLRLCLYTYMASHQTVNHLHPITMDTIPPNIKTLSLVMPYLFDRNDAFLVCQPIGHTLADAIAKASKTKTDDPAPAPQALAPSSSWKFRFEHLEYFEWGGIWAQSYLDRSKDVSPDIAKMPPSLLHYVHTCGPTLQPLPSRRETRNTATNLRLADPGVPQESRLLTAYMDTIWDEAWFLSLPKSITRLSLGCLTLGFRNLNMASRFPCLRSFETTSALDTNTVTFPNTLTNLKFAILHPIRQPLFLENPPPPSLRHLTVECGAAVNILVCLPHTLQSLYLITDLTDESFHRWVIPHLPPLLRSLRLKIQSFNFQHFSLLPRGLEELVVIAETMVDGADVPVAFDVSGLPPTLQHLTLQTLMSERHIRLQASMLERLPRCLRSLEVPAILLEAYDANNPKNARSNPISSFFGSLTRAVVGVDYRVSPEAIQRALALLPPDCWCKTTFLADIRLFGKDPPDQPEDLEEDVLDFLPSPLFCTPEDKYASRSSKGLDQVAARRHQVSSQSSAARFFIEAILRLEKSPEDK